MESYRFNNRVKQQELNYIQIDLINNYEEVSELCGGTGYDNETLLYVDFEIAK